MFVESVLLDRVKAASRIEQIYEVLSELQFARPSNRLTLAVHRKCRDFASEKSVRVAIVANFTLDLLSPHISTAFAAIEQHAECYVAPYNQYYQEILSETSGLKAFKPDLIFLSLAMQELAPDIHHRFTELSPSQRIEQTEVVLKHVLQWVDLAREHTSAEIAVSNFVAPVNAALGVADLREEETEIEFYQQLNRQLRQKLTAKTSACLIDLDSLVSKVGWEQGVDVKMYYLAKILWNDSLLSHLGQRLVRTFIALQGKSKKCLVLDLDNTLWGGILGEDGIQGVKVGKGDPESEAFADFQYGLKSLKQRGIILALCSKNNHEDVVEVFTVRNEMPLNLNDFAAVRINWQSKHDNIHEIAGELNIGMDSMVFIDDNPVEVNLVREMLPEVKSLLLPEVTERIPAFLDSIPYFEKLSVLAEDRQKTEQYAQNRIRTDLKNSKSTLEDYLSSLETHVNLRVSQQEDVERLHQLFTKTNQFNLTTIRYPIEDLKEFIHNDKFDFWCFSVNDKFGDLGIVGVLLLNRQSSTVNLDSFIMSCRAMGRGIETAVLNWLKSYYFADLGMTEITAKYIPTPKNVPVKDLFTEQGFEVIQAMPQECCYKLSNTQYSLIECDWINLISRG